MERGGKVQGEPKVGEKEEEERRIETTMRASWVRA